ncbi:MULTISPECIES: class II aldolase/adducin family protein [Clostridium]|uniref:L-fuculose-phosphate aldolase n=1 Tax=Clostridium cadaveris TaxID=1529 RepID=A0A1I2MS04_9CLOT|nr:class II aldolase/adducin family protein [Clostridium cadaveris]MDU4951846.1 class II aldolase/adducin family protein [Clostridium sp.]MDM8312489.1 class II aldolase/adducin family protein [Clostridium cadaveris]MDY4947749.1 class II aldolase/adducin family protein [Clostridium cadaveris]NME64290.1 class II aldolase/adducin family protein [Clostridium cadaveris]NWK11059.1 class II aldolase/adducin family protein [Clostridium cadaveris]
MLEGLKIKLTEIAKRADADGLCKHKSGNFSIRDESTGYVLVTPSGVSRDKLTTNHICVVDIDMNLIEVNEDVRPTSELLMHVEAYKCRPDVKAIVHTHSKFATAFSVLNKEIPPIVYEIVNIVGGEGIIKVAPYARPGTADLANSIKKPIKDADACLMANHGVLAVSKESIDDAFLKASYVEEVAEIYYRTLLINGGKEPKTIAQSELGKWSYPEQIKLNDKDKK